MGGDKNAKEENMEKKRATDLTLENTFAWGTKKGGASKGTEDEWSQKTEKGRKASLRCRCPSAMLQEGGGGIETQPAYLIINKSV